MKARVLLKISGRVQGVFYRQSTAEQARSLGLTGWVRNEPDGSVRIEAQGDSEKIEALIKWCWKGPPSALVSELSSEWKDGMNSSYTRFEIIR